MYCGGIILGGTFWVLIYTSGECFLRGGFLQSGCFFSVFFFCSGVLWEPAPELVPPGGRPVVLSEVRAA